MILDRGDPSHRRFPYLLCDHGGERILPTETDRPQDLLGLEQHQRPCRFLRTRMDVSRPEGPGVHVPDGLLRGHRHRPVDGPDHLQNEEDLHFATRIRQLVPIFKS